MGIDELLEESRRGIARLTPQDVRAAAVRGAVIVDTRTERQRREQGEFPGAIVIDRTVLEWRVDLAGGVDAWLEAGLPMTTGPTDVRL